MTADRGNAELPVTTNARDDLERGPQAPQSAAKGRHAAFERQRHAGMKHAHGPPRHHSQRGQQRAQRNQQPQQPQQLGRGLPPWDGDAPSLSAVPLERLGDLLLVCAAAGVPLRRSSLQVG